MCISQENGSEKKRFFRFKKLNKNLKNPKFRFFRFIFIFLVKFYTNHIKFHILIFICEFCYILQSELCIGCSSWVEILCPVLFGHLNLKKPKNLKKLKNLKT